MWGCVGVKKEVFPDTKLYNKKNITKNVSLWGKKNI